MANYRTDWQAISDRTVALLQAAEVTQRLCQNFSGPPGAYRRDLVPQAETLFRVIQGYRTAHTGVLPATVAGAIDVFLTDHHTVFGQPCAGGDDALSSLKEMLPALACLRAEVDYLLADTQEVIMRTTERAFIHLRRSIIADPDIGKKWKSTFDQKDEPALERLGAVHLLLHGIWAFKANAEGERTDLVLGTRLLESHLDQAAQAAEGLVLTEWKKVDDPKQLAAYVDTARHQAARYARSALAGLELSSHRYLVIVSQRDLADALPGDDTDDKGITYRHINIAVDPEVPSRLRSNRAGTQSS